VPTAALPRLQELSARYRLPEAAPARLDAVLATLEADPIAPTTVTDPLRGADVHIADSLAALEVPAVRAARRIADLGAGAGFPGLVLALALPSASVALVESVGKKCEFIARIAEVAGLENATAVHARAEEWADGVGAHDLVTARALAPLTTLVEYAAPLLVEGGMLCAWKGLRAADEEADGAAAAAATGLEVADIVSVRPWADVTARNLHLYVKVRATPERFPRRAGMARKRPIRASAER